MHGSRPIDLTFVGARWIGWEFTALKSMFIQWAAERNALRRIRSKNSFKRKLRGLCFRADGLLRMKSLVSAESG
jgi:hypothetical protein